MANCMGIIIPSVSSLHIAPGSKSEMIMSFFCDINFEFIEFDIESISYS